MLPKIWNATHVICSVIKHAQGRIQRIVPGLGKRIWFIWRVFFIEIAKRGIVLLNASKAEVTSDATISFATIIRQFCGVWCRWGAEMSQVMIWYVTHFNETLLLRFFAELGLVTKITTMSLYSSA